ncbi:BQ5605_C002g01214 [Microbotryum silenes-dioicae]|uniref:BQ5605_C002g01214 protein n=1 Tax=Microbotryum silenes-dioicae TaxID=796604 RepID=A0A2X0NVT1_9BASI|nr:BQ5605_C002g01214 [Microbotryum silenes-dioicae]
MACSPPTVPHSLPNGTHGADRSNRTNALQGDFKLLVEHPLEFAQDVKVVKWISQSTGLKVVWCDVEGTPGKAVERLDGGPLVQGYFATITEIFDDTGRPHTLEHLIFMGSEQYPYKGILDTLANRSFAQGTNAWTDTSNTTYTVGTAGQQGFLSITPPFLDHILYPTMTDAAFVTEVHHLNPKGEDSGVVFSEMQGRENGSGDLMQLRLQRCLYDKLNALRSETGGLMEALRKLKVQDIREYHAGAYQPQNVTLIVVGRSLKPENLLSTLEREVLPTIVKHGQAQGPRPPGWRRPFVESTTAQNPPQIPAQGLTETVEFPEQDESVGEIMLSWIGVRANDFVHDLALEVLGEYLTDSPVSPLYKQFVEVDEPACTDISFYASTEDPTILTVYLSAVPAELLKTLDATFKAFLKTLCEGDVDMERMESVLKRQKLQLLESIETNAADMLSTNILADAIFGPEDGSELGKSMDTMAYYRQLEGWSSAQWIALLEKYYVNAPNVTIIGRPSAALADQLAKEEKQRVAATVKRLGPEGLAELGKKLETAQAENDRPIPSDIISNFKVPDVEGIDWIKVESARSAGVAKEVGPVSDNQVQKHVDQDGSKVPLFVQYDHINSNFIEVSIVLFITDIPSQDPKHLRSLLPIYLDSFFSLPVTQADGTMLDFEEVVRQLDAETLSYSIDLNSPLQEGVTLRVKVEKGKYATAVAWLGDLLCGSSFSVDRLKVSTTKAIQNLPSEKRDGYEVAYAAYRQLLNDEATSTNVALNLLNRDEALPELLVRLKAEPEKVVEEFEGLRQSLLNPRAMRVQVKGDILAIEDPAATWLKQYRTVEKFSHSELVPVKLSQHALSLLGREPSKKVVIFGLPSIESSFGFHLAKGPNDWNHADQPALTVARAILNAQEGFLWKSIRGAGLAYGASISQDTESGTISYRIYKSPDTYSAFVAAQELITSIVEKRVEIDALTIESAKSSLAFDTANKESTMNEAANAAFRNVLVGLEEGYGRVALARTKDVTLSDILRVIEKYIAPIFDPSKSIGAVSAHKAKIDEMATSFEKLGYEVEKRTFGDADDDEDGSSCGSEGSASGSESGSE